jgi:hypothetical protein
MNTLHKWRCEIGQLYASGLFSEKFVSVKLAEAVDIFRNFTVKLLRTNAEMMASQ